MSLDAFDTLAAPRPEMQADPEDTPLLQWLRAQRTGPRVALYASGAAPGGVFLHAVLIPRGQRERPWDDLNEWSGNPFDHPSCGLVYGGGQGARVELHAPWDDSQPEVLLGAQQLVFGRAFDGRIGTPTYYELAQAITLSHDLHWLEERQAWCRFDDAGDLQEIAGLLRTGRGDDGGTLVWIDHAVLETHMAATDTCLAQLFEGAWFDNVYRLRHLDNVATYVDAKRTLSCKLAIEPDASSFRGVQFIEARRSAADLGEAQLAHRRGDREYETFLIQDFKHGRLVESSCAPKALASYFHIGSEAPFQTSPVFFRPDVLDRYKADREKYRLTDRTLDCRHAWSLKTYDVNAAGQVHTYIGYLGNLPLAEQRYWKAFNEPPKAPISERAYQSDFEGRWDTHADPLRDLKGTVRHLHDRSLRWFRLKQPKLLEDLNYPLTAAFKPWDDTIIDLTKLVVEGLEHKTLSAVAKAQGRPGDPKWASIRWLREALMAVGTDDARAAELVAPFERLQALRSKLVAHAGGEESAKIRQRLVAEFKTPRAHIEAMAADLQHSLAQIAEILPP
ncbi:MAG: hypothetical protein R3F10_05820 [Lysobacteraceae bacterium]